MEDEAEDAAIQILIETALINLQYNGHEIVPIQVNCNSSRVSIKNSMYENDHIKQEETVIVQKIMEDKKMTKRKLRENHPDIADKLKLFF